MIDRFAVKEYESIMNISPYLAPLLYRGTAKMQHSTKSTNCIYTICGGGVPGTWNMLKGPLA